MAKVLTFSQVFPLYHPRAGEPTYFVEQVLNTLNDQGFEMTFQDLVKLNDHKIQVGDLTKNDLWDFWFNLDFNNATGRKPHTIRSGHRFKQGEMASPRVWSGKPYNSPQIIFAPDIEVKKTYHFEIESNPPGYTAHLSSKPIYVKDLSIVAQNDGLSIRDFKDWFKWGKQEFHGQIICWKEVNYG